MDAYRHVVVVKLVDEGRRTPDRPGWQRRHLSQDELDARSGFSLPLPCWNATLMRWWQALQQSPVLGRLRAGSTPSAIRTSIPSIVADRSA